MTLTTILLCTLITVSSFLGWEFIAWFSHKYIMHGPLWTWHYSHHTVHRHRFEKNDLFAIFYSLPAIAVFYYFSRVSYNPYWLSVAAGTSCYGLFYFLFHDVIVHQRIAWKGKWNNKYLQRIINAHYIHHRKHTKDNNEAFGFLYAPEKYQPLSE